MQLKAGQEAKTFKVEDIASLSIDLHNYKGKKILLSFYRYAACPLCNLRVHQLITNYDYFKSKNLQLLAFFESPRESILKYVGNQNCPFPLIGDPNREIYKMYGIESSWLRFAISMLTRLNSLIKAAVKGFYPGKMEGEIALLPADFLINTDFTIHTAYYGKDIGDHLSINKIKEWLEK